MLGTFINIFKVPDLRNKILFTLALLCIYRIGFFIPVPGFDSGKIAQASESNAVRVILRWDVRQNTWKCLPAER